MPRTKGSKTGTWQTRVVIRLIRAVDTMPSHPMSVEEQKLKKKIVVHVGRMISMLNQKLLKKAKATLKEAKHVRNR